LETGENSTMHFEFNVSEFPVLEERGRLDVTELREPLAMASPVVWL
jgi:hypothetical protein